MADISLKYLTDLTSASSASAGDLFHINQDGNDKSITLETLINAIFDLRYPIGKVEWFANNTNPNDVFSGQVWKRIPGQGRVVRIANASSSDVLQTGGNDNVQLTEDNIPSHSHPIDLSTDDFDHGSKQTSSAGEHRHDIPNGNGNQGTTGSTFNDNNIRTRQTSSNGEHVHNVSIGAHHHSIKGDTGANGGGKPFSVLNSYIVLAAWYRTY